MAFNMNEKRGALRKNVSNPHVTVDGARVAAVNFSQTGFDAPLPSKYHYVGATAEGELDFTSMGCHWDQKISFRVVRLTDHGTVGATYEVLSSVHNKI